MYYSLLPLIGRCCSSPILKDHGEDIRVFFFSRFVFFTNEFPALVAHWRTIDTSHFSIIAVEE